MQTKRILSAALACLMAATVATGCSKNKPSSSSSSSSASGSSESSSSSQVPKATISIWQTPADVTATETDLQNQFKAKYPSITLNIIQTPQNADILSAMAAGTAPSLLANGYPGFNSCIYQGVYMPLDDYLNNWPDTANYDKTQLDTFMVNGKHYGIPGDKYALCIQYHKSLFKAAGITEAPKTWDEFLADCKKLTVPSKHQYGFALDGTQWAGWHFEIWVWAAGGDVSKKNADGTLALTFTDPAAIKAAEFYRTLEKANVIQTDRTLQIDGLNNDFGLNKAAMIVGTLGDGTGVTKQGGDPSDVGFFTFPGMDASHPGYNIDGGDGMGIVYTKDKNVEDAAWTYLSFMNSKAAWVETYKEKASKGTWVPIIPPRTDIDMSQFGSVPADTQQAVDEGSKVTKHEFYGKGAVGSFLDDAVAKIFGNTSSDITATLTDAQTKAASAVSQFNAALTKKS